MNIIQDLATTLGKWPIEQLNNLRRYMKAGKPVFVGPGCSENWVDPRNGDP